MVKKIEEKTKVVRKVRNMKILDWDNMPNNEATIEISNTYYSNEMHIRASKDDVHIDFLEMPGVIRENKMVLKGIRVYLSENKAKELASGINGLLTKREVDMKKGS